MEVVLHFGAVVWCYYMNLKTRALVISRSNYMCHVVFNSGCSFKLWACCVVILSMGWIIMLDNQMDVAHRIAAPYSGRSPLY